MSRFGKVFAIVASVIVVVVLGVMVGLWGTSGSHLASNPQTNDTSDTVANANPSPVAPVPPSPVTNKTWVPPTNLPKPSPAPAATGTNFIADWEEKIDAILTSEIPDNEKAKKMLEMFPNLSPEAQEEVAHHLSNLVPDEEYTPLGNYLTNAALPEVVLDVLLEDAFNRPNSVKLPRLLDIARNPQHPKASESKDVLELFLEEDYGNDWGKWQEKMNQWLKDNPD